MGYALEVAKIALEKAGYTPILNTVNNYLSLYIQHDNGIKSYYRVDEYGLRNWINITSGQTKETFTCCGGESLLETLSLLEEDVE